MFARYIEGKTASLFGRIINSRSKRMIVLASLFAKLCGDKSKIDLSIVHKFNQVLHLSNKDDALMFPIQITKLIWKDGVRVVELTHSQLEEHIRDEATRLVNFIPDWLRYQGIEEMVADIETVIRYQKQLQH